MDNATLTSTLTNDSFDNLAQIRVTGVEGVVSMRITAWARYQTCKSLHGSVVVLFSEVGSLEIDGGRMLFSETAASFFERAGFETSRVYRRSSQHRHHLRSVSDVMGIFSFLSNAEQSAASRAANHTPSAVVDPFDGTAVVYQKTIDYVRC
jgi:hypothetical protein